MDLNKDNKDVYTIDAESYTQARKKNEIESPSRLSFLINLLLAVLAVVISFFLYNIIKNGYTLNDVFNKERLTQTFSIADDSKERVKENDNMETLAKEIITKMELPKEKSIAKVDVKKVETPKIESVIHKTLPPKEIETIKEESITVVAPKVEEKPKEIKVVEVKKVEPVIVKTKKAESSTTDSTTDDLLSSEYLKKMQEEMNNL